MRESPSIQRKTPTGVEGDFEHLRREGLKVIQEFSGNIWTDYNLHDPGVTILEQLCYGLTDIMYRTEFPVEDLLAQEQGVIDFEAQGLHLPEKIFPCRPTTINDYRKVILDGVPDIENVWVNPIQGNEYEGLYQIVIRLAQGVGEERIRDIKEAVRQEYKHHRNLCEDVADIVALQEEECELTADIVVDGTRDPNHVLGDIYFQCASQLAGWVGFYPYEQALREGYTLEEILRGPLAKHGWLKDQELEHSMPGGLSTQDTVGNVEDALDVVRENVFSVVKGIEGVEYIQTLDVIDVSGPNQATSIRNIQEMALRLKIPQDQEHLRIRVYKNGRELPIAVGSVKARYDELNFERESLRRTLQDLSVTNPPPQGTQRNLQHYHSIQHHFPSGYGINTYGVPDSASPEEKGRMMQLKTYLLLFEQILANYTANLQNFRLFFSPENQRKQSYFYQPIEQDTIPNIEEVYSEEQSSEDILREVLTKGYDRSKYADRKNRLLDYLLALYGEKFSQKSLRHFNEYSCSEEDILENKVALFNCIVELSQHRAGAYHDEQPAWNSENIPTLKKKVSLLLGLTSWATRALTDVWVEQGLQLVPDEVFHRTQEGVVELVYIDVAESADRTNVPFQELETERRSGKDSRHLFEEIGWLQNHVISESILRNGIYQDRYRVGSTGPDQTFQIAFCPAEQERWLYVASYRTKKEAMESVNDLRHYLLTLNQESEGFHIVEHILLRPMSPDTRPSNLQRESYSFSISVIFPDWTAKFHNDEFKKLAEETISMNCPAHIYPSCYWLNFQDMRDFEMLWYEWLEARGHKNIKVQQLDLAAKKLANFLAELQPRKSAKTVV